MNSTKKVLKGNTAAKKPAQKAKQNVDNSKKGKVLGAVIAAVVVIISAMIAWENLHPRLILTVNGEKTYLEDMTYQIMQAEQMHNSIASIYQQMGSNVNYWAMEENGVTTQDTAKEQVIANEARQQILYAEAVKNGYEATEEEKKEASESAKDMLANMSSEQKRKTEFTEAGLTEILTEVMVAQRYRQDVIDGFDIDDDKIRAGVDKEQYREYKTQAFFVSTAAKDDKELTDAQKEELKQALIKEADAAKNTDDWSKALDTEDENLKVSYKTINFIKEDTNYDEAVMKQAMTMENGEISDVIEGKDGYYVVKMVDNNSQERYEKEVKDAITEEETNRFDEEYASIYETYEVMINDKEWDKVKLGNMTM